MPSSCFVVQAFLRKFDNDARYGKDAHLQFQWAAYRVQEGSALIVPVYFSHIEKYVLINIISQINVFVCNFWPTRPSPTYLSHEIDVRSVLLYFSHIKSTFHLEFILQMISKLEFSTETNKNFNLILHKFFIAVQPVTSQAMSGSVVVGCDTHPYQKRGSLGRQWFRFRWARAFFLFRTNSWSRILTSVLATAPDGEIQREMGSSVTKGLYISPHYSIFIAPHKKHFLQYCISGEGCASVPLLYCTSFQICDTNMEIITTSIHTSTDNGFLPTYRAHNLPSGFHWNTTETAAVLCDSPRRRTSWVSLSSRSLLNYHLHFVLQTNCPGRETWKKWGTEWGEQ